MSEDKQIEESTEYDNFLGKKSDKYEPASLADFLGMDDDDDSKEWEKHWVGMPEFEQEDNAPYKKLIVSFRNEEDYKEFAEMIGQKLTEKTKSIWHPKLDRDANALKRWIEDD